MANRRDGFYSCAVAAAALVHPTMTPERITARQSDALLARVVSCAALPDVRSASALARLGGRLVVVQDDHHRVAVVDLATMTVSGDPRAGGAMAKMEKPDWEAAFTGEDGTIHLVGSGSAPKRRVIERVEPDGSRTPLSASPALYRAVEQALGEVPNVEGAVRLGKRVRLFHRGSGGRPSATVDVPLDGLRKGTPRCGTPRFYDLGRIAGVSLGFTDAALLRGDRIVYLAVAEDTPDAIADGAVRGAAIGVISGEEALWTPLLEASGEPMTRKPEGLVLDPDGTGWLVSDPDDPDVPAQLCRLELRGPW